MPLSLAMSSLVATSDTPTVAVTALDEETFADWVLRQPSALQTWLRTTGFYAKPGTIAFLATEGDTPAPGAVSRVLFGVGAGQIEDWAALRAGLPVGVYTLDGDLSAETAHRAALGWAMEAYRFDAMKGAPGVGTNHHERHRENASAPILIWPEGCAREEVRREIEATALVRDLINTPASHMGPGELAAAAEDLAARHGATCTVIVGDDLLAADYPAIHAVGRAAAPSAAPRLIDMTWGNASDPKVTLVGKGVCFDTGGLNLKSGGNMKLMKKDMGGAAHVLGLAHMIMSAGLKLRLRVLIPAVENSVSAAALRPSDVVLTRSGKTVEIGNTDAEGRVILADALFAACAEDPELVCDFATLTGAARVALGTDIPALFGNDDTIVAAVLDAARAEGDPLWALPLWQPYARQTESLLADLRNDTDSSYGGAITAALFLQAFVASGTPWTHVDQMAWNVAGRPGRPVGGEAQGLRAFFRYLKNRFE
ncbi:leucyl aminopeptidase family protein [Varunaivibrio sulfuroxidans]|uniref:Leucyl aminopeptidase n=1 Tax=Varunaivibrio sulfuroxidans TaxID=1773489 RepID=A0A4V2UP64_9PROT|nr:leucyl aminopeptidase family protein [Varunaivibrio sulfuroxidans]TCS64751.1 leucyl aminopeptidase [Varunaivibrio sulfuroxidans]WES29944.1 leucyl aminopeptidase family protein [Varunaivibrio sulfuroxidans]